MYLLQVGVDDPSMPTEYTYGYTAHGGTRQTDRLVDRKREGQASQKGRPIQTPQHSRRTDGGREAGHAVSIVD